MKDSVQSVFYFQNKSIDALILNQHQKDLNKNLINFGSR